MIPPLVHQTWKNDHPDHWIHRRSQSSIWEFLPEWEYRLWTDEDLERLMQVHYPRFYQQWMTLDKHIKRVDVARLLILHLHGGLYLDLDMVLHGNPEPWLKGSLVTYQSTQALIKKWDFLGNAFIASEPNNPFLTGAVEWMFSLPPNTCVLHHTGPMALGKYWKEVWGQITILGPDLVDNDRCGDGISEGAIAKHSRMASWQYPDTKEEEKK